MPYPVPLPHPGSMALTRRPSSGGAAAPPPPTLLSELRSRREIDGELTSSQAMVGTPDSPVMRSRSTRSSASSGSHLRIITMVPPSHACTMRLV